MQVLKPLLRALASARLYNKTLHRYPTPIEVDSTIVKCTRQAMLEPGRNAHIQRFALV
jgi:hypothetical protein